MKPFKISKELAGAIAEEERRQAIDTAKKKAVAQHADYDTFKKMVSVAHLKPLHAAGSLGSKGCSLPSWQIDPSHLQQRVASADADAPAHVSSSSNKGTQQSHSNLAQQHSKSPAAADGKWHLASASGQLAQSRTSQEFVRDWKRHCPSAESKYRFLKQCGPDGLARLFKAELDGVILGQMLTVLQQQWRQQAQQQQLQASTELQQHASSQEGEQEQQRQASAEQQPHPPQQQATTQPQQQTGLQQQAMPPQKQHMPGEQPCNDSGPQSSSGSAAVVSPAADAAVVQEASWVASVLHSLSGVGRFDLNVRLMDKASKAAAADLCRELLEVLQQAVQRAPAVQQQQQQTQQQQGAAQLLADLQASMVKLRV